MRFIYGSYLHDLNECEVAHNVVQQLDARGKTKSDKHTLNIKGKLHGSSQSDLTARIGAMINAYSVNNKNAILLDNNGSQTFHRLLVAGSVNGVIVTKRPSFGSSDGGEYVGFRTYEITLEAEYYVSAVSEILEFSETLSISGSGGPRTVIQEMSDGPPRKQQTRPATIVTAQQSGQAVGRTKYPTPPNWLFPDSIKDDEITISKDSPQKQGGTFTNYRISWNYPYESVGPLDGNPNRG